MIIFSFWSLADGFLIDNGENGNGEGGALYLAINPLAFIDDDGNIIKRRLEVNVYTEEV